MAPYQIENSNNRVAVLVLSCDSYSDMWPVFFHFFRQTWPSCPYKIYLGSTTKPSPAAGVETVFAGEDLAWGDSALRYARQIPEEYILLIQEDFLILSMSKKITVDDCVRAMDALGAMYCRLRPDSAQIDGIDGPWSKLVGEISERSAYRISNQISLWRREEFIKFVQVDDSPWSFEMKANTRASGRYGILSTYEEVFTYNPHGALVRGKWSRSGRKIAAKAGVLNEDMARQMLSLRSEMELVIRGIVFNSMMRICPNLLRRYNLRKLGR